MFFSLEATRFDVNFLFAKTATPTTVRLCAFDNRKRAIGLHLDAEKVVVYEWVQEKIQEKKNEDEYGTKSRENWASAVQFLVKRKGVTCIMALSRVGSRLRSHLWIKEKKRVSDRILIERPH